MLALTACATQHGSGSARPAISARETITVAVGPCFGFCPVYEAAVAPDGVVRFTGERHTAALGERTGSIGSLAAADFARDLAPFRPASGTEAEIDCTDTVSDASSYTVTWTNTDGRKTFAKVQGGCLGGPGQSLVILLRDLPTRLSIAEWAKQTTRPGASRG
jgi:hypothetical protein